MKARFTVIVIDNSTGDILHKSAGSTVMAGAATEDTASVFFYPANEDEASVLIDAAEDAFGGVSGSDEDE